MRNILVVGGAGYVGGAVTDVLLARGRDNVRVYDNLLYEETYRKNTDFVFGDVRDRETLLPHLQWATDVAWLAAIVGDGACTLDPVLTVQVNEKTVAWLAATFDGRLVFTSTCSVYGAQEGELTEDSPVRPLSLYAGTKLRAEASLRGKNALILRLGTLFGVGDAFSRIRLDLVVNYLTACAFREGKLQIFGGDQFRPLLHVRDAARVIADGLDSPATGIFNLVGENLRVQEIATSVQAHFPDLAVEHTPRSFEDTRNYRVSGAKAQAVLGAAPRFSVSDGIRELKTLLATRRIKSARETRYRNHLFLQGLLAQEKAVAREAP